MRTLLSTMLSVVMMLGGVASAEASGIYWTDPGSATIGRANLDGTGVNNKLLVVEGATGIAVDQTYIYFATSFPGSSGDVGRAKLDGTDVNGAFIAPIAGSPSLFSSVAVDGTYLYWGDTRQNAIGRANLDGSGVIRHFITGVSPTDLTVDGAHLYWSDSQSNTIGRANLDGTGVNNGFITGASNPFGVAVDGTYVYWTNYKSPGGSIGRANLDGTGVNQSFIVKPSFTVIEPRGVAVDGTYIYWTDPSMRSFGRANLDGTDMNPTFFTAGNSANDIAVLPVPEPTTGLLLIAGIFGLALWRTA